jgi:hypothetical protein
MGGTTSKFDENDWEKADGKLRGSDFTIDSSAATPNSGVYYLTKRGVNQREFDVTDEESNLLFTTKQVPGTIACFDVLGRGIDAYVLRVTVDLSRRYWTVYRYNVPSFPGQLPDRIACQKLAAERLEAAEKSPGVETFQTPLLYKKACIVVSWSRYMAVSVLYGPPTARMVFKYNEAVAEIEREEEEKSLQKSRGRTRSVDTLKSAESGSELSTLDESSSQPKQDSSAALPIPEEESDQAEEFHGDEPSEINSSAESPEKAIDTEDGNLESIAPQRLFSNDDNAYLMTEQKKVPLRKTIRAWVKKQSNSIREQYLTKDKRKTLVDPSEGIMHLEKPLLLCQEIYTRIIGNHQTSLVTKEEVLELLQQDNKQHAEETQDHGEDSYAPILNNDDSEHSEGVEVDSNGAALLDSDYLYTVGSSDDCPAPASYDDEEVSSTDPSAPSPANAPGSPDSGVSEQKDAVLDDADEEIICVPEEDQPLVGYWLWEHSFRSQRMKMHVAKGTDLALHVVLAIITNQVRYERNAIAMTI